MNETEKDVVLLVIQSMGLNAVEALSIEWYVEVNFQDPNLPPFKVMSLEDLPALIRILISSFSWAWWKGFTK